MNTILYTNDLISIVNIPLQNSGFTKQFYIVQKDNHNIGAYHTGLNGFKTVQDFKDSILFLEGQIKAWKHDTEHVERLKKYVTIYNSIKTNRANTKFITN